MCNNLYNLEKNVLFSPGIEPGTFCVLDRCDNHYTTKTCWLQMEELWCHTYSEHNYVELVKIVLYTASLLPAVIVQWLGPCVVAAVTQVRILVTACRVIFDNAHTFRIGISAQLLPQIYSWGYSSVVEQSAAVRQVHGSNPCVPYQILENFQKSFWQRWDSNPRLRRDWCLKPAPQTARPRYLLKCAWSGKTDMLKRPFSKSRVSTWMGDCLCWSLTIVNTLFLTKFYVSTNICQLPISTAIACCKHLFWTANVSYIQSRQYLDG